MFVTATSFFLSLQAIDEYSGPLYILKDPPNPYVFMLFKQEEMNMVLPENWSPGDTFHAGTFAQQVNLRGWSQLL